MLRTTRKVAIITGASFEIGASLVAGYRGRDWAVVASAPTIKPSQDLDLLTVAADITKPATAGQIVDAALEGFGRIDTLVNNAGAPIARPFGDYTVADYASVVGASLAGFFWLTQRAIGEMAVRYGGHVVTINATPAIDTDSGATRVLAALAMGGLAAATRSLASEYASRGIRVNAITAGAIQTLRPHPAGVYGGVGRSLPPLGQAGQVSDIVDAVLFLESAPFITGEILHIDGGASCANPG
jgi:NAD(P)-dependent dehydrogenase (short-subunit alcohol dehydrogenase family)